ncbi:PepSY domain-containing protein [Streptomyces sp. NPDC006529]|uniref:PepSY domain-containing protein n=1 Tax=Streptomyces sp. NPDC006529 TaxID=3157177 RepID=UPI0033A3BD26
MQRHLLVPSAVAVVLMAGGPVAAAAAAPSAADAARAGAAVTAVPADASAETAATTALKRVPGVIESVDKDGSVWHVDAIGKNGRHTELEVDARSGRITQQNADDNSDDHGNDGDRKALIAAKVTAVKAMKAAVAARPGQVWSVSWDDDDNDNGGHARYWDVEVKTSGGKTQNVHVDPTSGKILSSHSDSGDRDNNDNDNDGNDDGN